MHLSGSSSRRIATGAVLSLTVLLAACGGAATSSAPPAGTPAPTAAASAAASAPASAAASAPAEASAPADASVCAGLGAPEKTDIKIGYRTNDIGGPAALLIGIENGYYADAGLNVEATLLDDVDAALIGGSLDLAVFDADGTTSHLEQGVPLKMIAGWREQEPMILFAGKGISSVADLEGKDVALGLGAGDPATKTRVDALKEIGWDLSTVGVNFVNPPGFSNARVQLMNEGQLAMTYGFPRHKALVTEAGGTVLVDKLVDEMGDVIVAKQDFIDANQNTLARWICASIIAKEFQVDPANKARIIEIVKKHDVPAEPADAEPWEAHTNTQSEDLAILRANLAENLRLSGVKDPGYEALTDLRALKTAWAAMGLAGRE